MQKSKSGILYWEVKVPGQRRWKLEHRYVMEQILGRLLASNEHVHHVDGNGLHNASENLIVMSASDHCQLTSLANGFGTVNGRVKKPHNCPCCGLFHTPPEA